jgi:hypothetical protein
MVAEDDWHIEEAEADGRHHEQIHRGDAGGMVAQMPVRWRRAAEAPVSWATTSKSPLISSII